MSVLNDMRLGIFLLFESPSRSDYTQKEYHLKSANLSLCTSSANGSYVSRMVERNEALVYVFDFLAAPPIQHAESAGITSKVR